MRKTRHDLLNSEYGIFEQYQDAVNSRVLLGILIIAIVFELLHVYLGKYLAGGGFYYSEGMPIPSRFDLITVLFYLIFFLFIFHRYELFPDFLGVLVIGFTLVHQLQSFFRDETLWIALVFWIVLTLVVAYQYIGPGISLPVIVASYLWFIFGLYYNNILLSNYMPFLWIMFATVILSVFFSVYKYKLEMRDYRYSVELIENNADYDRKLNFDQLTGLQSAYALNYFVENHQKEQLNGLIHIIAFDLDDMKICNSVYGRDIGDSYIQTFSKIIRFLVKGEDDIIARNTGDVFVAVLSSYNDTQALEKRLERYNRLLKEEFDKGRKDQKFLPHFSYGMERVDNLSNFQSNLNLAEKKMFTAKEINKKHLIHNNYFLPEINYVSLFNESNVTVIVWMAREGWPVAFVTENVMDLLGYDSYAFLQSVTLFNELMHPDDHDRVYKEVAENIKNKKPHFEQIYRMRKADGQYIWIRDYSVPVIKEGELIQINGYMYNINFEIEAEMLLEEQSQLFGDIIEATNVGTWEWDMSTGHVTINDRYAEMIGYTQEEIGPVSTEIWELITHPSDLKSFYREVEAHIDGKQPFFQMECRLKHKNGHWVWMHNRGKVMRWSEDGKPERMVGAQMNINELKRTESLLRQAEKLSALGLMAGGIAHDINNLLMMMGGYLNLAKEKDSIEDYRLNYEAIEGIIERASDTLAQILGFTKHHMYDPRTINLHQVLKELVKMIDRNFGKDLTVVLEADSEEAFIEGDRSLIDNALLNLCLNARDAMEKDGKLKLSLTKTTFTEPFRSLTEDLPQGNYICIQVKDNGAGIEEAYLDKVFDPFFTTKETGGGIGLSMVEKVIREHGGGIQVHTRAGKGTVFSLYFPESINTVTVETEASDRDIADEGFALPRVMIVDDEPVVAQVLDEYLKEKGCQVISFTSPKEALKYYYDHSKDLDLVLLDMLMPDMIGTEVFSAMLKMNDKIKVLYLSGYSEGVEISDDIRDNVLGFMKKPVKLSKLFEVIEGVMN